MHTPPSVRGWCSMKRLANRLRSRLSMRCDALDEHLVSPDASGSPCYLGSPHGELYRLQYLRLPSLTTPRWENVRGDGRFSEADSFAMKCNAYKHPVPRSILESCYMRTISAGTAFPFAERADAASRRACEPPGTCVNPP
eukprot:2075914-Rhodomonas_salina.2